MLDTLRVGEPQDFPSLKRAVCYEAVAEPRREATSVMSKDRTVRTPMPFSAHAGRRLW